MENPICSYEGCNEWVNSPHDETLCVFHAPAEKKGISVEQFNNLIWLRINRKNCSFRGFVFPGDVYFRGECRKSGGRIVIVKEADFSAARFMGKASFGEIEFTQGVSFRDCRILGDINFSFAKSLGNIDFKNSRFGGLSEFYAADIGGNCSFSNAIFEGNASFVEACFNRQAWFMMAVFRGYADFGGAKFLGDADFRHTEMLGRSEFTLAKFQGRAIFEGNVIRDTVIFENITLSEKSRFYFQDATLKPGGRKYAIVTFDVVYFNPFAVYFANIRYSKGRNQNSKNPRALLIFRYCQLKDAYFTNNDMSLFSFYKTSFDEARFISSRWGFEKDRVLFFPFTRKNLIPEEKIAVDSGIKKRFMLEDLNGYEDVAALYRCMKTALDNTKDYQQASWFYFNEFEMKRLALKEETERSGCKIKHFARKISSKYLLYWWYRTFAGYGEKPLWSTVWFFAFSILFAVLNMINGLDHIGVFHRFQYSLTSLISSVPSIQFWKDFLAAWFYSLSRLVPVNYLSADLTNYVPIGSYGNLLSFANFVILFVLATFVFIGLKRHFRRF